MIAALVDAPRRDAERRSRRARPRLCRRDARRRAAVSRRPRRGDALRRRDDEPAPVGPVDAGRHGPSPAPRRSSHARARARAQTRTTPARTISTSTRWRASTHAGARRAAADRLGTLMPGAGHIVHMPSHIYYRVGRYADAAAVNVQAVKADRAYFAEAEPSDIYRDDVLPAQPRLHLACREHGGAKRRDRARGARVAAAAPPEMVAADVGHGDGARGADPGAGPLRPLGRDPARAGAARGDAVRHRRVALRARSGLRRHRPAAGGRARAGRARGDPARRVAGAHARRVLQDAGHAPLAAEALAGEIAVRGGDGSTAAERTSRRR